ncbi:hypothetical protein RZN05_04115 [Sphingomonas sp. HF-S4]|uniref:Uncharacterized protein n=1 Tax=Sphingomonas agrestis TaxID=3080540 RepID=A0ABU3Y4M6_9SPHN|nr:hypothetical protein [Sphingomonas sp. HF-S4]MDV3456157.1 hypothetical protein [Sphingomonas sp. HF-S4]
MRWIKRLDRSRANRHAIALECEMRFEALPIPGEATLVCVRRTLGT